LTEGFARDAKIARRDGVAVIVVGEGFTGKEVAEVNSEVAVGVDATVTAVELTFL